MRDQFLMEAINTKPHYDPGNNYEQYRLQKNLAWSRKIVEDRIREMFSVVRSFKFFSLMCFKTIHGYQRKTLVQVEALTADALFQHSFHPLRPNNQDFEFGQFLLG